jgi:hypothetical protein
VTHPFTSVPATLVNTVGVAVTTVGAGFTPARSGVRGSTQPAYLSEGDTRVPAIGLEDHNSVTVVVIPSVAAFVGEGLHRLVGEIECVTSYFSLNQIGGGVVCIIVLNHPADGFHRHQSIVLVITPITIHRHEDLNVGI